MMRSILAVCAMTVAALGLIAAIIFAAGDSRTLVPPPESAAEGFVRQIAASRYRQTRQYIASDAQRDLSPGRLEAWHREFESRHGTIGRIGDEPPTMSQNDATVRLQVHARGVSVSVSVSLQREQGLWKVNGLPKIEDHK